MGQQRLQRAVEHVAVQGLSGLEQKGLVPVVTIGDVFVEECLVNRQELHAPLHRALINLHGRGVPLGDHCRQPLDCLQLE